MDVQARGLIKGLENWAKKVTTDYRDVEVRNMSSSFRNGLAFCAIIHHYRPDLIDFESLAKENIFENNSLAFGTAEKQLGVPALLDADDMVKYEHPDRLSIITYLSQLHNCFENQNKVKNLRASFRRSQKSTSGPPPKVPVVQPQLLSARRHEVCHTCKNRVFILERLIVDSKLYHTACFRCSKCGCLLNPGAYVESDTPGLYECAVCLPEESSNGPEVPEDESSMERSPYLSKRTVSKSNSPLVQSRTYLGKSPLSESVNNARANFLQTSLVKTPEVKKVASPFLENDSTPDVGLKSGSPSNGGNSVKDKVSAFESNRISKPESFFKSVDAITASTAKSPTPSCDSISSDTPARTIADSSRLSQTAPSTPANSEHFIANVDSPTASSSPIAASFKFTSSTKRDRTPSFGSDKMSCDNTPTSPTVPKVPGSDSTLQSPTTEGDARTARKLFQIGDYKSPLKSRNIFQTNLQPLKLSLSSTPKQEPSPDFSSMGAKDVPPIRSTYSRTLPRPGSDDSLSTKLKPSDIGDTPDASISSALHSKWSRTARRRSSLESGKPSTVVTEVETSVSTKSLSARILPEGFTPSGRPESKFHYPASKLRNSNIFRIDRESLPIPSIRHSLEVKKNDFDKSDVSVSDIADVGSDSLDSSKIESKTDIAKPVLDDSAYKSDSSAVSKPEEKTTSVKTPESKQSEVKKPETPKISKTSKSSKRYPGDLNPFGDDEEEEEEEYPDELNPFGDEDDEPEGSTKIKVSDYDESKNPFASDDDDDSAPPSVPPPRPPPPQKSSPHGTTKSSPSGSLRGTLKKRAAPKPPKLSEIFQTESVDSEADSSLRASPAGARKDLQTPSPKVRKSKPAPPPPPGTHSRRSSEVDLTASTKQMKDADNLKIQSTAQQDAQKQAKKKKRPAPPVPIPKRRDNKKIPLKDILREMREIEEKQRECERQGREIELLIRDRDKDEEPTVEEEEYIMQLFELVNQKNALFRRQAELMYIKRSQRLMEQQAEIETQIRQLLEKPEAEKSDDDRAKEEELILELKDIVDQRSSIIDSIEMDRRRELEEDASVQEQIEIKNGDLPITAEIKEKNSGKQKKSKEKKEKKKKKHEGESSESKKSSKKKGLFK